MDRSRNVNRNGAAATLTRKQRQDRRLARLVEDLVLAKQLAAEHDAQPPVTKPIREWADAFLVDKRVGGRTGRTLDTYKADLDRFMKAGGDLSPLGPRSARAYLNNLKGRGMKTISLHRHFRSLRSFFSWCQRQGAFERERDNPLHGFEMKIPYVEKSAPTDADMQAMLRACDRGRFEGRRDFAMLHVLGGSGLRISEACALRWRDVVWAERKLLVHGKGSRDEFSPFDNTTAAALKAWRLTQHPDSDDGFVLTHRDGRPLRSDYGTHLVHKISRRAKTEALIGPHALRRRMATALLQQTGDIELVRKAGRWRSYAMVQRYAKIAGVDVTRKFVANGPMDRLRLQA